MTKLEVKHWGSIPYLDALARQKALVADRKHDRIPDQLVLLEHPAVYTIGARKDANKHLLWSETEATKNGVEIVSTNRGGDITYHGPGQLVAYPIINLSAKKDLHAYLRDLEEVIIRTLRRFKIQGARRDGLTGIWCEERKIAALGVAVQSWVTYHGFSLNIDPNLEHFSGIVPCGIQPTEGTVTSMRAELGEAPVWQAVETAVIQSFTEVFN